ncbi:DUF6894 family protein [Methylobacterium organophilum]|uniref:DUF6894 family protein n=1 Tax=Methylobacterium organophilum TaxID=410 RepID=UPI001EE20E0D|nr:hypothetical protein [Methylobacterium organophilum]UMY17961.1 hypothetical protein MMB17_00960 [Methylobacterium organophilum]
MLKHTTYGVIDLARYYFDLQSHRKIIRDEVGVEIDDPERAFKDALAVVEEMRTSGELNDADDSWVLVARDNSSDKEFFRIFI